MSAAQPDPRRRWFVTDLDGTLLDATSYGFAPARPALRALAQSGAGLVLASSKTRTEMEPLARELGLVSPLIVENGGAVWVCAAGGAYRPLWAETPVADLAHQLAEISAEVGVRTRGFSSYRREELARLTGLAPEAAGRAQTREFGEPFVCDTPEALAALETAALRRGLRVTRGGRFWHLGVATDKGRALEHWLASFSPEHRPGELVGLGDAANDLSFLERVARPILVPGPDGHFDPLLAARLPGAERAPAPGPRGWNLAVLAVLAGQQVPTGGQVG